MQVLRDLGWEWSRRPNCRPVTRDVVDGPYDQVGIARAGHPGETRAQPATCPRCTMMPASTKAGPFAITRIKTSLLRSTEESALKAALAYGAFQVLSWAICECPKVKYRRSARFRLAVKGMAIFTRA